MKRPATVLDSGTERRRQNPVSCVLCRSKKLKCTREHPCSNCFTRGVACDFGNNKPPRIPEEASTPESLSNPVISDILARLQRLERNVFDTGTTNQYTSSQHQSESAAIAASGVAESVHDEAPNKAFDSAESAVLRNDTVVGAFEDRLVPEVVPITHILTSSAGPSKDFIRDVAADFSPSLSRRIRLPLKHEAFVLMEVFSRSIQVIYHILHTPSVCRSIETLYTQLDEGRTYHSGFLALFLAILANGAYFWTPRPGELDLFTSTEHALTISAIWRKWSLDTLDHNRRLGYNTLEDIQATCVVATLVHNMEGYTTKPRILLGIVTAMARDLRLHVLDSPRKDIENNSTPLEDEIKRRLWWYIVGCDWIMATISGPYEGTYSILPQHMQVRHPKNANDEDFVGNNEPNDMPLDVATEMSHFHVRIRQAEMARKTVDNKPFLQQSTTDYDSLMAFEESLPSLLPRYFTLDQMTRDELAAAYLDLPQLQIQRLLVNIGLQHIRLRLHRPYLIRGSRDTRFSASRRACLDAARKTIMLRRLMDEEESQHASFPAGRICYVIHHTFMSTLVLALELCFNKPVRHDAEEQERREVRDACATLERDREQSPVAQRYLTALMDILRKHKIRLQEPDLPHSGCVSRAAKRADVAMHPDAESSHVRASVAAPARPAPSAVAAPAATWQNTDSFLTTAAAVPTASAAPLWVDMFDFPPLLYDDHEWDQVLADLDSSSFP